MACRGSPASRARPWWAAGRPVRRAEQDIGQRVPPISWPRGTSAAAPRHLVAPGHQHRAPGVDDDHGPRVARPATRRTSSSWRPGSASLAAVEALALDLLGRADHDHRRRRRRGPAPPPPSSSASERRGGSAVRPTARPVPRRDPAPPGRQVDADALGRSGASGEMTAPHGHRSDRRIPARLSPARMASPSACRATSPPHAHDADRSHSPLTAGISRPRPLPRKRLAAAAARLTAQGSGPAEPPLSVPKLGLRPSRDSARAHPARPRSADRSSCEGPVQWAAPVEVGRRRHARPRRGPPARAGCLPAESPPTPGTPPRCRRPGYERVAALGPSTATSA